MGGTHDRARAGGDRGSRTRAWIVTAFNRLVLGRRYETLSVGEVSRRAGVGRSSFYEHFRDKDELLRQAMHPVLEPLARAAVGRGESACARAALEHIAGQRVRALALLDGPARVQVELALAELIGAHLADAAPALDAPTRHLESARLAGAQVALIRAWLREAGGFTAARVAEMLTQPRVAGAAAG